MAAEPRAKELELGKYEIVVGNLKINLLEKTFSPREVEDAVADLVEEVPPGVAQCPPAGAHTSIV